MKTFQKISNGHTLNIIINEDELFQSLDEDIKKYEDLKQKCAEYEKERVEAEENNDENYYDYRYEYDMQSVYGDPESDFCTPDEIIADLNGFKNDIKRLAEGDGEELWRIATLKKNGTFKKTVKPTIREAIKGNYCEDSYGWNTLVLRLEPRDDTHMYLELDTIVLHY